MAPRFQASGVASFCRCKFRLNAYDDGKVRCFFETGAGHHEVAARFRGLSEHQFRLLVSKMEQHQSENISNHGAVPLIAQYTP